MPAPWMYELEKYAIVVVALVMAYAEFAQYFKHRKSWIKFALGVMALYWAAYYSYSIYRVLFNVYLNAHQIFVRSGILLTLALVGANALMTLQLLNRIDK
jgi:hypothetical protein